MRTQFVASNQIDIIWYKSNQSCNVSHVVGIWKYKFKHENLLMRAWLLVGEMQRDEPLPKSLECLLPKNL